MVMIFLSLVTNLFENLIARLALIFTDFQRVQNIIKNKSC
ncbi:hypothetical protein P20429_3009 [Pseudoalteromonas sp. BSi20429]|uniref:Uncharacterized protein n=1 Tax=Pseudoalteromonas arctica A 37-1-2 TaxID=1117313 RepID=A0A290S4U9_9GAMM|nr:hypothetical protein PARC_a1651 [Pseudoalteromonas arctica A 37-1-2]GAA68879.1 hypothetical protein P20429_3009 [Pseudoalteromonas sp. BSi20429]